MRPPTRIFNEDTKINKNDDDGNKSEQTNRSSTLWSIVTSVIRFASFSSNGIKDKSSKHLNSSAESNTTSPFIIKRCASFAGNKQQQYFFLLIQKKYLWGTFSGFFFFYSLNILRRHFAKFNGFRKR